MIINGQLHNAQIINAGQIVTTPQGQSMIQTTVPQNSQTHQTQNVQLCQLVQTGNGTVQMIQQNGQPAQIVQIQRSDDRCEIIVQPQDIQSDAQYYTEEDLKNLVTVTAQAINQEEIQDDNVQLIEEIEEIEEEEEEAETVFTLDLTDDSECEDKEYLGKIEKRFNTFLVNHIDCWMFFV